MQTSRLSARDISKMSPSSYRVYDSNALHGETRYWDDYIHITATGYAGIKELRRRAAYNAGLCLNADSGKTQASVIRQSMSGK